MRHVARECGGISFVVAGLVAVRHLTLGSTLRPFITLTGTLFILGNSGEGVRVGASQPAIGVRCSGCLGRCACPFSNGLRLPCLSVCASVSCLLERFASRFGFLLLIPFLLCSLRGCKEAGLRDPFTSWTQSGNQDLLHPLNKDLTTGPPSSRAFEDNLSVAVS